MQCIHILIIHIHLQAKASLKTHVWQIKQRTPPAGELVTHRNTTTTTTITTPSNNNNAMYSHSDHSHSPAGKGIHKDPCTASQHVTQYMQRAFILELTLTVLNLNYKHDLECTVHSARKLFMHFTSSVTM